MTIAFLEPPFTNPRSTTATTMIFCRWLSVGQHGTMYQLRNLIALSNVNADPIHKFNECEDFFKLVVTCHILVAAMEILHMEDLTDIPTIPTVGKQQDLWMQMAENKNLLYRL